MRPRRFVDFAGLDADDAVLDYVDASDRVFAADLVQRFDEFDAAGARPSSETGMPRSKPTDLDRLIRRVVGRARHDVACRAAAPARVFHSPHSMLAPHRFWSME